MGDNSADAHTFVGNPVDTVLAHLRPPDRAVDGPHATVGGAVGHAGMVQSHDLPSVVEHRGARGARGGVGLVVQEVGQHVDDLVLAQADLLGLAAGMLDDVGPLRGDRLALFLRQEIATELGKRPAVARRAAHRDHRIIEIAIGVEERFRLEHERDAGRDRAVGAPLVVELGQRAAGNGGVLQDVVVGHEEARRDHEAGAVAGRPAAGDVDPDPRDGARHPQAGLEERHSHQVVGAEKALERFLWRQADRLGRHRHRRRRASDPRFDVRRQATATQELGHPLGRVDLEVALLPDQSFVAGSLGGALFVAANGLAKLIVVNQHVVPLCRRNAIDCHRRAGEIQSAISHMNIMRCFYDKARVC